MMKKFSRTLLMMLAVATLTGCTNYEKEYDKNTLVVKGNGSLVEVAVEDFKESSVKAEDLSTYIEEQITNYNNENGKNSVKSKALNTDDMSKVKLVISYKDIESYNGFNLLECKLQDFSEIETSDLKGTFTSVDGKSVKVKDMENTKKAKVLIISEATDVVVKGDVLYYNNEVSVKDDVVTTSGEDEAIIIFK